MIDSKTFIILSFLASLALLAGCPAEDDTTVNVPADPLPPGDATGFAAMASGTDVNLAWTNPTDANFAGVVVRRHAVTYPGLPSDGDLVYSGSLEAATDMNPGLGTWYYTIFTHDGMGRFSGGANASDTVTTPSLSDVTSLTATGGYLSVDLSWTNPTEASFAGVMVRRSAVTAPAYPDQGDLAYFGTGTSWTDYPLEDGTTYHYGVFAYDTSQNYTSGVSASAVTDDTEVTALGWIGGGTNGWKTVAGASAATDVRSFGTIVQGIFVDDHGFIYVPDYSNARVCKWDRNGTAVGWIGGGSNGWKTGAAPVPATDYQSFSGPSDVYVTSNGDIYVNEETNHRISKWDSAGNAIGWIGGGANGWQTGPGASAGSDYQSFDTPTNVFLDGSGNLYVTEWVNCRVSKWDASGNAVGWIGGGMDGWQTVSGATQGTDLRSFRPLHAATVDSTGNIYVADVSNNRICKWDASGNAVGWFGGGQDGWQTGTAPAAGTDFRSFNSPTGLFLVNDDTLYIADTNNHRVSRWTVNAVAHGWFGGGLDGWAKGVGASSGNGLREFSNSYQIFVDDKGYVFVADRNNARICKWKE